MKIFKQKKKKKTLLLKEKLRRPRSTNTRLNHTNLQTRQGQKSSPKREGHKQTTLETNPHHNHDDSMGNTLREPKPTITYNRRKRKITSPQKYLHNMDKPLPCHETTKRE